MIWFSTVYFDENHFLFSCKERKKKSHILFLFMIPSNKSFLSCPKSSWQTTSQFFSYVYFRKWDYLHFLKTGTQAIRALKMVNKRNFLKIINLYYSEEKQRYQVFIPGLDTNGFNKESLSKAILANKQDDVQIRKLFGCKDESVFWGRFKWKKKQKLRPNDCHCIAWKVHTPIYL